MDIEVVMTSRKATSYVRGLKKIHKSYLEAVSEKMVIEKRTHWGRKSRKVIKTLPPGIDKSLTIKIEPAGEIIN